MSDSIKENVNQLKKKLSGLKRRSRFVDWKGIRALASELRTLVYDIKENITDPKIGIGLIASFYETDEAIFGNSDDSSGYLSEIYRFDAHDLFLHYASQYLNKDKIIDLLLKLYQQNNYGARDTLIDRATEYMPKEKIRSMLTKLQKLVDTETNAYQKNSWLHLIESLAKQIKDALLFEKTRITSRGTLSTAAYIDIAEVYFESGDPQTALTWLAHVSREERFQAEKRDQLLLAVYDALGKTDEKIAMAWQIFRRHRSADALQKLVVVIGDEKKDQLIVDEAALILKEEVLSYQNALFLIETRCLNEAETYLLDRANQLNGNAYDSLLPLAKSMEAEQRYLVASLIYRALLDSILQRAQTKTYSHGVRYLKKLDKLADLISDWHSFDNHQAYFEKIHQKHRLKTSFWSRYE